MVKVQIVLESKPINVSHDTYRRECRYIRGVHIPMKDFLEIMDCMTEEIRLYFDFHNPGKPLEPGTYLNGYSGLARTIAIYYQNENSSIVPMINNGKDFYVKII
ncbi:hypothetical protein [Ureibacillus manganicus]|uniref:Leucyl-tRNA synthetase n=1 Tax=Ureibacillus manganicus DSM 26584 TaxID=1384049 RepID=A0A0A3I3K4_9BACL|nr:hypothetical protein [Ureibacillus manganicus]KGR79274.1 leucyl-tRNA synthetase [Ureibacillus manganicus DSM 26584]